VLKFFRKKVLIGFRRKRHPAGTIDSPGVLNRRRIPHSYLASDLERAVEKSTYCRETPEAE
jgi:hypothetical protein